uniref:tRNA-intron lyase n=1 Tax=Steinernema glaseri TaxID=37863 RepID=A0A1I7YWU8_9BILA
MHVVLPEYDRFLGDSPEANKGAFGVIYDRAPVGCHSATSYLLFSTGSPRDSARFPRKPADAYINDQRGDKLLVVTCFLWRRRLVRRSSAQRVVLSGGRATEVIRKGERESEKGD